MDNPLGSFKFQVEWGGTSTGFAEVSGLGMETDVIEYRNGNDPGSRARKIPGLTKFPNITLKRGITIGDNEFFQWILTANQGNPERRDIVISLLNENHEPVVRWTIRNAWPTKLTGPNLVATGSEVAIETLELVHEGLEIENS